MNLGFLQKIGLTAGEIKVYNAVLELGISSLGRIQEKTGIERRNIYDILNKLIEKGLISYIVEKGKKTFQTTHPNKIFSLLDEKKKQVDEIKHEIKPHLAELERLFNQNKISPRAEIFRGVEAIKALLEEVLEYKESYWMGGNSFEQYSVPKQLQEWWYHNWMKRRAQQKHLMYDLVSHGTFITAVKGYEKENIVSHKKLYYKCADLPKGMFVPMVIIIFGNKVAQIQWGEQPFAFVIESKKIKESFMIYFKYFWKKFL